MIVYSLFCTLERTEDNSPAINSFLERVSEIVKIWANLLGPKGFDITDAENKINAVKRQVCELMLHKQYALEMVIEGQSIHIQLSLAPENARPKNFWEYERSNENTITKE